MGRTDEASLVIEASPVRVYKALVDADAVAAWLPPDGMTGRVEHFDATPGGSYRMMLVYDDPVIAGKSGGGSDVVEGRFTEVEAGVKVVQEVEFDSDDPAFAGVMTMTWQLAAEGMSTRVTFRADDVPSGISADDHIAGMTSSLEHLARIVTS